MWTFHVSTLRSCWALPSVCAFLWTSSVTSVWSIRTSLHLPSWLDDPAFISISYHPLVPPGISVQCLIIRREVICCLGTCRLSPAPVRVRKGDLSLQIKHGSRNVRSPIKDAELSSFHRIWAEISSLLCDIANLKPV